MSSDTATRRQPWLKARRGESEPQRLQRAMHSCWRCGRQMDDLQALATHEDECRK